MNDFPFTPDHKKQGKALIQQGSIKNILFSQGTYQVEIEDPKLKETIWPFLQLDDHGHLKDSFCTCDSAEKEKSCPHLAAALLITTREKPLHIRLLTSLWNELCLIAFERYGIDPHLFTKKNKHTYVCLGKGKKEELSLTFTTPNGMQWFEELVIHRAEETEETSLKLSNISTEELTLWQAGTPSKELQYELSFWSDFAKWMLSLQERNSPYTLTFASKGEALPTAITATFPDFSFTFKVKKADWKGIIPTLKEVNSPLKVHLSQRSEIKKASYDKERREMTLTFAKQEKKPKGSAHMLKIGKWEFKPGEGFFAIDTAIQKEKMTIPPEKLGNFLTNTFSTLKHSLISTPLTSDLISPSYELFFDLNHALHIRAFAFEEGDLTSPSTALFLPWVYTEKRGFFRIDALMFDEIETLIPSSKVEEFIAKYQLWLNQCEGFHLHLSPIEFQLSYHLTQEKTLQFKSEFEQLAAERQLIDFDNWLYIKGKGFYKKKGTRYGMTITSGMSIEKGRISSFINANREALEHVKLFFATRCPVEKVTLDITLTEDDIIVLKPHYFFSSPYRSRPIEFFGDFTYVPGEGFSEIPSHARLPKKYQQIIAIEDHKESFFVPKELPKLEPFIEKIDPCLSLPQALQLQVKKISKDETSSTHPWIIELVYASEWGEEGIQLVKENLDRDDPYATTQAGLLFLDHPRFNWLRELDPNYFSSDGKSLILSTIDWMRLRVFEEIHPPTGEDSIALDTRLLMEELDRFETAETLRLKGLKSVLRPYQEIGVKWLWFLYSYSLSGLLCDDMGLGKTHQAMALLAAAKNATQGPLNYLIICPTSVLYHWEELLSQFLPKVNVSLFYGPQRSLQPFHKKKEVLLTSYGILRSEKTLLTKMSFDIAIFDEIQTGKNIRSQTHKALASIKARTKIGLTGTPIENRLLELKALFDIVLPSYFPSLAKYREHFIHPIEKYRDSEKKELLSKLIHPFVMRRKKSEVLSDLPDKIEEIAHCSLSEEQQKLYREVCIESRSMIKEELSRTDKKASYLHVFSLLNTLKQICNHPCLHTKELEDFENHQSGKWDLFVELLAEARNSGQKLVVFTQYLGMMKIIELYLKQHKIGHAAIQGATRNRKSQLKKFREDPSCEVFIASLRAVGTGVDLTAGSVVIHYDRWWNPAKENQATDRVHRIGQNRGVQVFKLVTKGTIEDHIHQLILKKTGLLEGVVGYDDQDQIKQLGHSDIIAILQKLNQTL